MFKQLFLFILTLFSLNSGVFRSNQSSFLSLGAGAAMFAYIMTTSSDKSFAGRHLGGICASSAASLGIALFIKDDECENMREQARGNLTFAFAGYGIPLWIYCLGNIPLAAYAYLRK